MFDPASLLSNRLRRDLSAALATRERERIATIRVLLSAIANAQAVPLPPDPTSVEVPRRVLSPEEVTAVLLGEIAELEACALELRTHGRAEEADRLLARALLVRGYIPVVSEGG